MGRRYRLPSRLVQRIRRELGNIYDTIAVDVSQPSFHCRFSSSKPTQLPPLAIHALRLCLGAYRTFPSSSLCVEANEPPLYFRHKKLSLQYCLKLSCNYNNPAYASVFNSKFHSVFERKPTQLPPLAIRVSNELQAVGFKKE